MFPIKLVGGPSHGKKLMVNKIEYYFFMASYTKKPLFEFGLDPQCYVPFTKEQYIWTNIVVNGVRYYRYSKLDVKNCKTLQKAYLKSTENIKLV